MKFLLLLGMLFFCIGDAKSYLADHKFQTTPPQSPRVAHYLIHAELNHTTRSLDCFQEIQFTNISDVPIRDLRIYMYLNSFRDRHSSFLRGTTEIFGNDFMNRKDDEWGWIQITKCIQEAGNNKNDISASMKYIQPDDGNIQDASVLQILLAEPILPGHTHTFHLDWKSKMPKTIARMGYDQDFYLFCHWYPQLGVWEKNIQGAWGWNCHQAFRNTEFYGDFAVYDVYMTLDAQFQLASSGTLQDTSHLPNKKIKYHYRGDDLIDFAWAIDPYSTIIKDQWKQVDIRLMLPKDYSAQIDRYLYILKYALQYMEDHVGPYPYPVISVVCPPFHALRSGLMEYPTLITTGSVYGFPSWIRTTESLLVHEFVHQYFMAVVATNEKEEPWLDEGITTYFEDRIIDACFGRNQSLVNFPFYKKDNRDQTRLEYTEMKNPAIGIVARPGWEFERDTYKPLIYAKTATTLHTLQNLLGEPRIDSIFKTYYNIWKFKHPRGNDFMDCWKQQLYKHCDSVQAKQSYDILHTSIYTTQVMDFGVEQLQIQKKTQENYTSTFTLKRLGNWIAPVEVEIAYQNGEKERLIWDGIDTAKVIERTNKFPIESVQVDPDQKYLLDIHRQNNSITTAHLGLVPWKWMMTMTYWLQNIFNSLDFFF